MSGNVGFDNKVCECGYEIRINAGETRVCPKCFETLTYLPPPRQSMKKAFATVPSEIRINGPEGVITIKTKPDIPNHGKGDLYGIVAKEREAHMRRMELQDAEAGDLTNKFFDEATAKAGPQECLKHRRDKKGQCVVCGEMDYLDIKNRGLANQIKAQAPERGPGLRAQGGKYTEPGNVVIYCDNGNDEL